VKITEMAGSSATSVNGRIWRTLAKIQPGKQQETLRNMLDVVLDWVSTHNLTLARALPDSTIRLAVR